MADKNWENGDARYILTELWDRTYPTNVVKDQTDIEHILPKTIENVSGWGNYDEDTHKKYLKKIGNLILLNKKDNRGLGNNPFDVKLKKYIEKRNKLLDIDLETVITAEEWIPEKIETRTTTVVNAIVSAWPIITIDEEESKGEGEIIIG